ncbi:hypothetical protein BDZ90DRAFT_222898 [Jaminaea rosea]|uniref:Rhodanese domain-containing protein n=1 Tax=Jaminaea rosea TaxID=1569628 RepID=A0A316URE8_9BASI|nr:hypothetical protein BDZ90DRAFT_222898 [Jaminaea rosea]PWN25705.1 hypothetical protein BDZ90DRAFT_222898 [Jaminaea rosea]
MKDTGLHHRGEQDEEEEELWPPAPTKIDSLPLTPSEYQRYGRQMILPGFGGLPAQLILKRSRVLVVGAGGLGCPAVQYLALGGVGHITVVDHDVVERSNLARQCLHTEKRIGMSKAESIRVAVEALNPHVTLAPITQQFTASNALPLVSSHDLVLDCTDNPLTRYLINDAAVLCGKAVVSGAAQGLEGQLVVLHRELYDINGAGSSGRGPCYRCLFPVAPRPQDVTDCSEGGVLGTITGLVGTLQANETIKLLLEGLHRSADGNGEGSPSPPTPTMLLASPMSVASSTLFRSIKLRPRRTDCRVCGDETALTAKGLRRISSLEEEDYISFCGLATLPPTGPGTEVEDYERRARTSVQDLTNLPRRPRLVVDVRTEEEWSIIRLPRGVNTISECRATALRAKQRGSKQADKEELSLSLSTRHVPVLCKRGNDSKMAVAALEQLLRFVDITGGLTAWSKQVDPGFPMY